MRQIKAILIRVFLCSFLAVVALIYATRLMDSLYAFRSPLHANPPSPGEPLLPASVPPLTRQVIVVLIDALRVDTASNASVMPTLAKLRQGAAWATMHSRPPSYSDPGYSTLFIGAWPELHDGPVMNVEYEDTPTWTQDNLFSAAHRRGLRTAVSAYYWFEKLIPQDAVSAGFYTPDYDQVADRQVVDAALPWLRSGDYQLVLIHLDQVDTAGHYQGGPRDERWNQAAQRADELVAEILGAIDLNQDTLVVFSDHGQIDRGGHGGDEAIVLQEPFILAGAGVRPGFYGDIEMVDVAPTLAALLGTNLPASSQGHVLTEMLALPAEVTAALPDALMVQQTALLQAYQKAIGSQAIVEGGEDIVATHQAALETARDRRLNAERLPRIPLAIFLALLPIAWFAWKRRAELPWFILAGLIYLLVFNLRYAIIDGRTYSLSSVASANDIIAYTGITAALSLIISWLVTALARRVFKLSPGEATLWTLDMVLFIIYLLLLPGLWSYALNGTLVGWTLPHFRSMFLSFLALIQMLTVAVVGILLALLYSAINRWVKRKGAQPRTAGAL